jgi:hypothetical protein
MFRFIKCAGVEIAAALVSKAKSVTIVDVTDVPFQLALGKEIGGAVKKVTVHVSLPMHAL